VAEVKLLKDYGTIIKVAGINEKAKVLGKGNLLIGGCHGSGCVRFSANVYWND